jgi:hypothetical protein
MGSKYLIMILFVSAILLPFGCRTQQSLIKKTQSFSLERSFGTVKEQDGEQQTSTIDTLLVVYAEVTTNQLLWDTAVLNGKLFKIIPQLITTGIMEAGFDEKGQPIVMKVRKGNFLYQLQFERIEHQNTTGQHDTLTQQLIYFRFKNKKYKTVLSQPVFLHQFPPV